MMQVNPDVIGILEEAGLKFVGRDETGRRMEVSFLPNDIFVKGCLISGFSTYDFCRS